MCAGKDKDKLLALAAIAGVGAATGGFGLLAAPAIAGEAAATGGLLGSGFAGIGGAGEAVGADLLAQGALPTMAGGFTDVAANPLATSGLDRLGMGLERAGRVSMLAQNAGLGQQPQRAPMPQPMGVQPLQTQSGIPSFAQTYPTNIVDEERKRRLMRNGYG